MIISLIETKTNLTEGSGNVMYALEHSNYDLSGHARKEYLHSIITIRWHCYNLQRCVMDSRDDSKVHCFQLQNYLYNAEHVDVTDSQKLLHLAHST